MASSRKLPVSYNEKTYGVESLGRDYSSISSWESDTDINMVSAGKGEVLTCYPDLPEFPDGNIVLEGNDVVTSSSYFRVIRSVPKTKKYDKFNEGVIFNVTGKYRFVRIYENYSSIYDIVIKSDDKDSGGITLSGTYNRIVGCILYDLDRGIDISFLSSPSTINIYIYNTCIINSSKYGIVISSATICGSYPGTKNLNIINCNIINSEDSGIKGFANSGETIKIDVTNSIVIGSGEENLSKAGSYPSNITYTTTNAIVTGTLPLSSDKTHLISTSTSAINKGKSLSSLFTDDIDGQSRPYSSAWDIGADEYTDPLILTQNINDIVLSYGNNHTFTCGTTGPGTIHYQWYKSSTPTGTKTAIGTDSSSLTLLNIDSSDQGYYSCLISNEYEEVWTDIVFLEAVQPTLITQHPDSGTRFLTQSYTFNCLGTGPGTLIYRWYKYTDNPDNKVLVKYNSTFLTLTNLGLSDQAFYICSITSERETVFSNPAYLTISDSDIAFITHPQDQTKYVSQDVSLYVDVMVLGDLEKTYQWHFNGNPIPGETNRILSLTNLQLSDTGLYKCLVSVPGTSEFSNEAYLYIIYEQINITEQPISQETYVSKNISFSVEIDDISTYIPQYQWYFNETILTGENSNTLILNNVSTDDIGNYYCRISSPGAYYVDSDIASLDVETISFLTLAESQTKYYTQDVTFSIEVKPYEGITHTYQWGYIEYTPIGYTPLDLQLEELPNVTGENTNTLHITNIQDFNRGQYVCIVTVAGTSYHTISNTATLTASQETLDILQQPQSGIGFTNQDFTFEFIIRPPETFTVEYQWFNNGYAIPNQNTGTLLLENLSINDNGTYHCELISSLHGTVLSDNANLTVFTLIENLNENTLYTISPFSDYSSNITSRLNRTKTYKNDCILGSKDSFNIASFTDNKIYIQPGKCVIDDILIEADLDELNPLLSIDLLNSNNFINNEDITTETGYYYVCIFYRYIKSRYIPKAKISIIHPSDISTFEINNNYLLLSVIHVENVLGTNIVTEIFDYDPNNINICRQYKKKYIEKVSNLPLFNTYTDIGRIILLKNTNEFNLYYGGDFDWVLLESTLSTPKVTIIRLHYPPTDDDYGYLIGTIWINTIDEDIYICVDNTQENTRWIRWIEETGTYPDLILENRNPSTIDAGYSIGSIWINEVLDDIFILTSDWGGIATWIQFGLGDEFIEPNLKKYFLI